jgi:hypothetical protein
MADEPKQINFTIVPAPDAPDAPSPRLYSNFCAIAHTPFDFTLTFCEVMPLSEKEIKDAESDHVVRAPVRVKVVVPVPFLPNLIAALQEHWRVFSENNASSRDAGAVH